LGWGIIGTSMVEIPRTENEKKCRHLTRVGASDTFPS
jgi:hypothetical protein